MRGEWEERRSECATRCGRRVSLLLYECIIAHTWEEVLDKEVRSKAEDHRADDNLQSHEHLGNSWTGTRIHETERSLSIDLPDSLCCTDMQCINGVWHRIWNGMRGAESLEEREMQMATELEHGI